MIIPEMAQAMIARKTLIHETYFTKAYLDITDEEIGPFVVEYANGEKDRLKDLWFDDRWKIMEDDKEKLYEDIRDDYNDTIHRVGTIPQGYSKNDMDWTQLDKKNPEIYLKVADLRGMKIDLEQVVTYMYSESYQRVLFLLGTLIGKIENILGE